MYLDNLRVDAELELVHIHWHISLHPTRTALRVPIPFICLCVGFFFLTIIWMNEDCDNGFCTSNDDTGSSVRERAACDRLRLLCSFIDALSENVSRCIVHQ